MSITITITDPTPAQIAALFGSAAADNKAIKDRKVNDADDAAREELQAKRDAKKEVETADAPSEDSASSVPTKEELTAAAQALVAASGREALAELVEKFKAKNLSSIAEGDRAAFIAQCKSSSE